MIARHKISKVCLIMLTSLFVILYTVFTLIFPITQKQNYECEITDVVCELSESSPFYTKNYFKINDTLRKQVAATNITQELIYQLDIIPNSHICINYCFQGNLTKINEEQKYKPDDFQPVITQATMETSAILSIVSIYIGGLLICIGMLASACLSVR